MKKRITIFLAAIFAVTVVAAACDSSTKSQLPKQTQPVLEIKSEDTPMEENTAITLTSEIAELKDGFYAVKYEGNYGFDTFLNNKGASTDGEVVDFLVQNLLSDLDLGFLGEMFGCSTIATKNTKNEALFGRNFDWQNCDAMVVASYPENDYASISTVNMDFIRQGVSGVTELVLQQDSISTVAALYAPLDGMNEKGLAVAVNMIQDNATINQDTQKPDITTTTAVRMLLNKAATTNEAVALLQSYDMHASMGLMVHFAIADAQGNSVVVEYINNEMTVTKTPAVTNFYLASGEKNGIGSQQSHERYDILMKQLTNTPTMETADVRDALDSVSKDNFNEFESTEWSIVFNQSSGEAVYYHRENYKKGYVFKL